MRNQSRLCGLHVNIIEALVDRMNLAGNKTKITELLPPSVENITPSDVEKMALEGD